MKPKAPVAPRFKRRAGVQAARTKQQKQQKRKIQRTVEIVRPWTTPQFQELAKEDRDIVLNRLEKEVVAVAATRSQTVLGVNQVARAIARGHLRVVVFANNPETLAFGHLPMLCRLHRVPICVLHLSSKTFGRTFALKSLVAVGIKGIASETEQKEETKEPAESDGNKKQKTTAVKTLTEVEKMKVESITNFLISKASKKP